MRHLLEVVEILGSFARLDVVQSPVDAVRPDDPIAFWRSAFFRILEVPWIDCAISSAFEAGRMERAPLVIVENARTAAQ